MPRAWHREEAGPASAVRAAIADPRISAVYVVGPAGSGKSFLLDRLTVGLAESATAGEERYAGDRPLVSLRSSGGAGDLTLSSLVSVRERWSPAASRTGPVESGPQPVAVDDIDQLDESSLALLGQAIDQRRVRVVATVRSSAAAYVLEHLRIVGESLVVSMEPWRRREVDGFVSGRLGGRIHTLTVARLLDFSGGNALCVTELVDEWRATGSLRQEHGVWFSEGELRVPPVTAARIGSDLPQLSPVGRDVVDAVALGGATRLAALEGAFGAAAIEEADDSGLLRVEWRQDRLDVALRSPIEGRVIVHRLSTTRRRRLSALLALPPVAGASARPGASRPRPRDPLGGPARQVVRALLANGPTAALELAGEIDVEPLDADRQVAIAAVTGWCHLYAGTLGAAREVAGALRDRGTAEDRPHAYQLGALLAGRCELAAGDASGAQVLLSEAAVLRADPVCAATAESALTQLALAYAMAGDDVAAIRTLDATRAVPAAAPAGVRASLDQLTRAEVLLEKGLHHAAAERASAVADRCLATGQALVALQALHLCARAQPSMLVATRLGDLADRLDFALARIHHRHAIAAARGDAARMADVAAAYDGLGLRRLAGETAATALSFADTPRTMPWAAISRRLLYRVRTDPRVAVPTWWWHEDGRSLILTEREREIAELASSGASSPQIAERLHLSRRTVENHLQHAYRKLGISRRDQLGAALRHPGVLQPQG